MSSGNGVTLPKSSFVTGTFVASLATLLQNYLGVAIVSLLNNNSFKAGVIIGFIAGIYSTPYISKYYKVWKNNDLSIINRTKYVISEPADRIDRHVPSPISFVLGIGLFVSFSIFTLGILPRVFNSTRVAVLIGYVLWNAGTAMVIVFFMYILYTSYVTK